MAFRMPLNRPLRQGVVELTQIMNVSAKVGPLDDCTNDSNDLDAVGQLLNLIVVTSRLFRLAGPVTNFRTFNAVTGFYIYTLQTGVHGSAGLRSSVIDGCISRARDAGYGSHTLYSIVALNLQAAFKDPRGYELFMQNFPETPGGVR